MLADFYFRISIIQAIIETFLQIYLRVVWNLNLANLPLAK